MISDDDLIEIPAKIRKIEKENKSLITESLTNEYETCIICLEPWTTGGDHKIVSIKCGHVFGQKCIESWISNGNGGVCPTCKRTCNKNDVRPLFLNVQTVRFEDNTEFINLSNELMKTKSELKLISEECSQLKLMNKLLSIEMGNLSEENKRLLELKDIAQYRYDMNLSSQIPRTNGINFQLIQILQISAIGGCRVMAYSQLDNKICISCPSSNRIVTGFGVRVVDVAQSKVKKYINLHSQMIRNIEFNPFFTTNLMLSCSLDKTIKLTNISTDTIVSNFTLSHPVWCCAWSTNNNIVYAGLSNGNVEEIDIRDLISPVKTIANLTGGPIISMRYIKANEHLKASGLLVTNAQSVVFLHNPSSESESLVDCKLDTLLMASKYGSTISHMTFNEQSFLLLITFRPNKTHKTVRYLFSTIGSRDTTNDVMYASDVRTMNGAHSMEFMTKTCFLTSRNSDNIAITANEENKSIKLWDLNNSFSSLVLYPKDVCQEKPVLDICQYDSNPLSFAVINCDNLYFYKQFE